MAGSNDNGKNGGISFKKNTRASAQQRNSDDPLIFNEVVISKLLSEYAYSL